LRFPHPCGADPCGSGHPRVVHRDFHPSSLCRLPKYVPTLPSDWLQQPPVSAPGDHVLADGPAFWLTGPLVSLLFIRRCRPMRFRVPKVPAWCSPNPCGRAACRQACQAPADGLAAHLPVSARSAFVQVALSGSPSVGSCRLGRSFSGWRPVGHSPALSRSPLRVTCLSAATALAHPFRDGASRQRFCLDHFLLSEERPFRQSCSFQPTSLAACRRLTVRSAPVPASSRKSDFRQPLRLGVSLAGLSQSAVKSALGGPPLRVTCLSAAATLGWALRLVDQSVTVLPSTSHPCGRVAPRLAVIPREFPCGSSTGAIR
jgi:hypothetical protein